MTVKEETKQLSAGEYDTYAKIRGQTAYKNLEGLFNDSDYEKLSTEEKESVVKDIYNYSNAVAKTKVSAYELDGTPAKAKAAEDVGIEAYRYYLIKSRMDTDGNDSVTQEEAKKALDASGLSTSQKAYLFALQNKAWKDNPYK